MTCPEWQTRIEAYVDGELASDQRQDFRLHAAGCPVCASAVLAAVEAKAALRRAAVRYTAPPDLRARIQSTLAVPSSASQPAPKPFSRAWPRWAMAAAAALLLAVSVYVFAVRDRQPNALAEFADLHVAALASANPVDVVSTDRHTVKPWFQGRIPFTFDLPDLQGSPFTLTGGRVTYFHQEPGAQLIFAYQRHSISAFILRDTPQLSISPSTFTNRGTSFNLQSWTHDGLRYVLVSDVNAATLNDLAALLRHQP